MNNIPISKEMKKSQKKNSISKQQNNISEDKLNYENDEFQNSDFKRSEGKFSVISNDSFHKSNNIKSDSIDIEESNNNSINENKKYEDEEDDFEEERVRAFDEVIKKDKKVDVIKEEDEEYESDIHLSSNIKKSKEFFLNKQYNNNDFNDNSRKDNYIDKDDENIFNDNNFNEDNNEEFEIENEDENKDKKYINKDYIENNINDNFNEPHYIDTYDNEENNNHNYNIEDNNNEDKENKINYKSKYNRDNNYDYNNNKFNIKEIHLNKNNENFDVNIVSPIKDNKYLETQSDIVNQKLLNYSPLISNSGNENKNYIDIKKPNLIKNYGKIEEKKIKRDDDEVKINNFIKILKNKNNSNLFSNPMNNYYKKKENKKNIKEKEKEKENYLEKRRKKMEDIKNIFSNEINEIFVDDVKQKRKITFKNLVKITNSVSLIRSNSNDLSQTGNKILNNLKKKDLKKFIKDNKKNSVNYITKRNKYITNDNLFSKKFISEYYDDYSNENQNKLYELDNNKNKKLDKIKYIPNDNTFFNFEDGFYNENNKEKKLINVNYNEKPKYSERTFRRGYIMPANPMDDVISAKAYFLYGNNI